MHLYSIAHYIVYLVLEILSLVLNVMVAYCGIIAVGGYSLCLPSCYALCLALFFISQGRDHFKRGGYILIFGDVGILIDMQFCATFVW